MTALAPKRAGEDAGEDWPRFPLLTLRPEPRTLCQAKGQETKAMFQKQFGLSDDGVCFVKCDVTIKEDWLMLWDSAEKLLNGPIDILINNAGIFPAVSH